MARANMRMRRQERQLVPQFEALLSKGVLPGTANDIVEKFTGHRLRAQIAGRIYREFEQAKAQIERSLDDLPLQPLKVEQAIPTNFISRQWNKFLVDFQFSAVDPLTGEERTITNTLGLPDGRSLKGLQNLIEERLQNLEMIDPEKYLDSHTEIDRGSVRVTGFFQTLLD